MRGHKRRADEPFGSPASIAARLSQARKLAGRRDVRGGVILARFLDDPDPSVREAAAQSLIGYVGVSSGMAELRRWLRSGRADKRQLALTGLIRMGTPDSLSEIVGVALSGRPEDIERLSHLMPQMPVSIEQAASAIPILRPLLSSADPELVRFAMRLLDRFDDRTSNLHMAALSGHEDPEISGLAKRALGNLGVDWSPPLVPVGDDFDAILAGLQDAHPYRREYAARLSAEQPGTRWIAPLTARLRDTDSHVRVAAAFALLRMGDGSADAVRRLIHRLEPGTERRSLVRLLAAHDPGPNAFETLLRDCEPPTGQADPVRDCLVRLVDANPGRFVPRLIEALDRGEGDPATVVELLSRVGGDDVLAVFHGVLDTPTLQEPGFVMYLDRPLQIVKAIGVCGSSSSFDVILALARRLLADPHTRDYPFHQIDDCLSRLVARLGSALSEAQLSEAVNLPPHPDTRRFPIPSPPPPGVRFEPPPRPPFIPWPSMTHAVNLERKRRAVGLHQTAADPLEAAVAVAMERDAMPPVRSPDPEVTSSRFAQALAFAASVHAGRFREDSGVPYLCQALGAASLVIEDDGSESEAIAALLHDVLEAPGGDATIEKIRAAFGERVAAIVGACSDSTATPKPSWRDRRERYLARVSQAPIEVRRVAAAHWLHDARSLLAELRRCGAGVFRRLSVSLEDVLWHYDSLGAVFKTTATGFLGDELTRVAVDIRRVCRPRPAPALAAARPSEVPPARPVRPDEFLDCCSQPRISMLARLSESSHDSEIVERCGACGALWLRRFSEEVSFVGEDAIVVWYWRLTEEESQCLVKAPDSDRSFLSGREGFVIGHQGVSRARL